MAEPRLDEEVENLINELLRPLFNHRNARASLDLYGTHWKPETLLDAIVYDEQQRSAQTRYNNAVTEIRSIIGRFSGRR